MQEHSDEARVSDEQVAARLRRCPICGAELDVVRELAAHFREEHSKPPDLPEGCKGVVTYDLDAKGEPVDVAWSGFSSDREALAFAGEVERAAVRTLERKALRGTTRTPSQARADRTPRKRHAGARRTTRARAPASDDSDLPLPRPPGAFAAPLTDAQRTWLRHEIRRVKLARYAVLRECPECLRVYAPDGFRPGRGICRYCEVEARIERRRKVAA